MIEIFLIGLICHIGSGNTVTRAALIADNEHVAQLKTPHQLLYTFEPSSLLHPNTHIVRFVNPNDQTFAAGTATIADNFAMVPHLGSTTDGTIRSSAEKGAPDWAVIAYVEFPTGFIETAEPYEHKAMYIMNGERRYEGCVAYRTRFYSNVADRVEVWVDGKLFDYVDPGERVDIANKRVGTAMPPRGDFAKHNRLLDTTVGPLVVTEARLCKGTFFCDDPNSRCDKLIQIEKGLMTSTKHAEKSHPQGPFHPKNDTSVECSNSHWP
jgi:hypothetical protein